MLLTMVLTLASARAGSAQPYPFLSDFNVTAFAGVTMDPAARPSVGVAVGGGSHVTPIRWELEFARSRRDPAKGVPSIGTFTMSLVVEPNGQIPNVRFYGVVGAGVYGELYENRMGFEPDSAWSLGGGAKLALMGPLKLRLDYRAFFLAGSGAYASKPQRLYAGIGLGF
jgi:hypothetical protein